MKELIVTVNMELPLNGNIKGWWLRCTVRRKHLKNDIFFYFTLFTRNESWDLLKAWIGNRLSSMADHGRLVEREGYIFPCLLSAFFYCLNICQNALFPRSLHIQCLSLVFNQSSLPLEKRHIKGVWSQGHWICDLAFWASIATQYSIISVSDKKDILPGQL